MKRFAMVAALATAHWTGAVDSTSGQEVESAIATITVTNLTKGQILTPAVVITHSEEAPRLFVPGEPASAELAALAELGSTNGLTNKFSAEEGVLDVTTLSEFIHPTRTATVNVKFDANHWLISSASMLEMTNDGFVSLLRAEVAVHGQQHLLRRRLGRRLRSQYGALHPNPGAVSGPSSFRLLHGGKCGGRRACS